jgi:hypothetical protein
MKSALVFIYLLIFSRLICSQSLIGIWQLNSPEISSGFVETYRFFPKNSFEYHVSGYDGLSRIRVIGGSYNIKQDSIIFITTYTIEKIGGHLERSELNTLNNSWSIEGTETKRNTVTKPEQYVAIFKKSLKEKDSQEFIIIDSDKYFKVSNDPYEK